MSDDLQVPTRVVHLPLSQDGPACRKAIDKYTITVHLDAPWCPSNLEFIRRISDLPDEQVVWNTVFDASYLVTGLGDVHLDAPVAALLDPCYRLATTKYNSTRTWTAENLVGISGAYLCVHDMEDPGSYQSVDRTLQIWNRYHEVADSADKPWLLCSFDQLCFHPVSANELLKIRRDFPLGRYPLRIEYSTLRLAEYQQLLARGVQSIDAFRDHQQRAFNTERDRWIVSGQARFDSQESAAEEAGDMPPQPGEQGMESLVSGNLWQVQTMVGCQVRAGDVLVVPESMKMEIPLLAPCDGRVRQVNVQPGSAVRAGQRVTVITEEKT